MKHGNRITIIWALVFAIEWALAVLIFLGNGR
jgi:hypothetical protein